MVCPHGGRDQRVRACLGELASYQVLGTFHSHPAWGKLRAVAKPSQTDIASMPPGDLDLIIAVNDARIPRRFRYAERGRLLKGTVCDYSLTLAAFYNSPYAEFSGQPCVRRTLIGALTLSALNPKAPGNKIYPREILPHAKKDKRLEHVPVWFFVMQE